MALDSLGLGLTLDTTILEKADKTLENMHKNSKLIMQNLTRGFTAFSEGKIGDFTKVFENMSKAMDKLSNATVSPDFDTRGLQKGLGYISQLTTEIEKMQRAGAKHFFNPKELYTTIESTAEVSSRLNKLYALAEGLGQALKVLSEYPQKIREAENEIAKIDSLLKRTKAGSEKNTLYGQKKLEAETALKEMQNKLAEAKGLFGDLDNARIVERRLKEEIEITQQQLAWTQKTKAEQLASITSYNDKIIADEKARTKEVETLYRNNFAEMQKISKSIAQLESDRERIVKGGGDTTEQDTNLAFYRDQLQKRIELEEEITKSGYQKIAKIKEELDAKSFLNTSKQQVKNLQTDLAYANQFSKNAKNINEEKEAIKLLTAARDNLSQNTAHYSQVVAALNKRILSHKDHIEAVTRVEKEQNTLADSVINRYRKQLKALDDIEGALDKLAKKRKETGVASGEDIANEKALKARRTTIEKDILEIEKQAQGQLDVIREQHEAERAKKSVEETIRQNEREKQEYAKLLDDLHAIKKQKQSLEEYGGKNTQEYANLEAQEQKYQQRITAIRRNHMYDRAEIEEEHNKKVNDEAVREFIAAEKEKQRIAEETQKKIDAYNEKYGTTSKKNAEMAITSYSGAQNINQHKQAIEGLQQVRARLDNTDKDYYETLKKLNREIHSHELFIRAAENESVRLGESHRGLMDISGQLMRRLALVFSVSQMTQYFRKLVEVRGQFEKTEVALTSIVGSQEKSNKLMNQTIALAIKSPFTLQQLTGYTKQLAAYQVAYDQLHDTTKMLADVSAGLGVEMDRLILAFGQVKAANYLRATEVRQFTEAGFNILGELAKYYSELEGTMVSVGDVQERVTKRMVDFADVEEIFHRVTSAGGMFYDMQSRQAETLAGQWTNLQDRIDVMLNEIGSSNENVLKFFVRFLASAIDNWEVLASSIKTAATAFLIFKTYSLLAGDGIKLLAIQMGVLTDSVPKVLSLGQAFKTLRRVVGSAVTKIGASMSALLTNPIFLAIAAIGALIGAGVSLYRHFDKMNDALKEQSDSFNEYTSSLNGLSREYNKLDKFTEKLAKLEELKSRLNERGLNLSVKIDEVNTDNIDKIFTENSEILQKSYELGLSVGKAITRGINAAQGNIFGLSTFGENLAEDAEDFAAKWNKLASYGMDTQMRAMENEIEANEKASEAALAIYETIREGRKAERDENGRIVKYLESEFEWTIRRAKALKEIQDLEDDSVTKNNRLARYIRQVTRQENELNHEVDNTVNKLAKEFKGIENLMQAAKDNPVEFSAAIQAEVDKQAWDEVTKWVYSQKLHARLDIEPNYVESQTEEEKLAQFQQDLKDARTNLKEVKDGYQNFFISEEEIKNMKFFSDGLEGIQKLYDDNKKTIKQLNETKDSYSKEEKDRLLSVQAELKRVAALWNYDLEEHSKGNGKGKDELLERLKNQISLIKEMNKEYEKLNKTFSKAESLAKVQKAYASTAKELGLDASTMNFADEGTIKSLEALLGKPEYAANKYVIELQKALDNFKVELGIEVKQEKDKDLKAQVQKLFDQYDLSLELKKLNIPPDLAKSLFDVDYLDLDGLKKAVEDQKEAFVGKDMLDEYDDLMKKIGELSRKRQEEEAKEFINFLKKNLNEIQVIQDKGAYNIALADRLFGEGKINAEQYMSSVRQIIEDTNKEVSKANLELFKDSPKYIQAMGDLTAYSAKEIRELIKSLEGVVAANSDAFSADEAKAYVDAIYNAQERLDELEKSPFRWETFADIGDILKTDKEINEQKAEKNRLQEQEKKQLEELVLLEEKLKKLQEEKNAILSGEGDLDSKAKKLAPIQSDIDATTQAIKDGQQAVAATQSQAKTTETILGKLGDKIKSLTGKGGGAASTIAIIDAIINGINDTVQGVLDITNEVGSVMESFGKDTDMSTDFGKFQKGFAIFAESSQHAADGWNALKSGDPVGAVVSVVKSVTSLIRGINEYKDAKFQVEIDKQAKEIERLGKAYEKLEKATEDAYSIEQLQRNNEQLERNIELQRASYKAMIAAEESKKNSDEEQIAAWNEELEELTKQLEEAQQSLLEGVGGVTDFRSQTRDFVDSWVSAFQETGNGLSGLKENFRDFFDNIIAEQAALRVTEKFLAPFYESLNTALGDLELTAQESKSLRAEADKIMPELSKALELIWNELGGSRGDADGGRLSALQKGIQGITEDTAQVLEAYLNSVRLYVATINADTTSQLNEVKAIHRLLESVTTGGHSRGGVGFKVFMD